MSHKKPYEFEYADLVLFLCVVAGTVAMGLLLFGCGAQAEDGDLDIPGVDGTVEYLDTGEAEQAIGNVPNNFGWLNTGGGRCQHTPKNYGNNVCLLPKFGGGGLTTINYVWANDAGTPVERQELIDSIDHFILANGASPFNSYARIGPSEAASGWQVRIRLVSPGEVNQSVVYQVVAKTTCPAPFGCTNGNRYQYGQVIINVSLLELHNLLASVPAFWRVHAMRHVFQSALEMAMGIGFVSSPFTDVRLMNPSHLYSWPATDNNHEEDAMLQAYRP